MAATDTTDTTTQPAADPNAVLNTALQYLMGQRQQAAAPPAPVNRSIISLLGEALGGGASDVAPADREAAGTRALLNFGANLSAASGPSVMPRNFGQILAQGVGGAEQSLGSSAAVSASRLAAQQAYEEKQQELTISRIKESIPLLQMLQTQQVQKGLLGGNQPPSTNIASAGNYEGDVGTLEGSGKSATSTAAGVGQFIEPTWQGFVAANPDLFKGMTPQQILDARNTPEIANKAITWLAQQNAPVLAKAGVTPSGPSLALAHKLGPAAAAAVMQAPESAPVADVLVASIGKDNAAAYIKANPDLGTATAGDLKKKYAGVHAPGFLAPPASAPGATAPAPTATAPPAAPGAPTVTAPAAPVVATGGEAAGPGGLATRNARMTTVSPAAQTDADTIIRGMIGARADPTTLAPPGGPPVATVDTAGPGAPTETTTQPPAPTRVPDVFTPQPVTLPDYIQNRIDHPESDPAIERAFRKEVGSAVGPDAGKLMNQAIANQATAIAKVKADAITEAAAYRKDTVAQQMENWKVLRAKQDAADAATLAHTRALETQTLTNRDAQINSLRDKAMAADDTIMTGLRTDAANAGGISKRLQMLRSVEADMPESGSQFFQNHKDWINYFQEHIGLAPDQLRALSSRELFSRLLTSLATDLSEKSAVGAGTARGVEIKQNVDMLPDLATDHEGRLLSLGFVQNLADDQMRKYKEAEVYRYKNSHPDPTLDLHQSLIGFDTKYEEDHPSIIPRAPRSGPTEQWMQKNVRPGMVYERWVPQMEPLTNQPVLDPTTGRQKGQWIKRTRGDDE